MAISIGDPVPRRMEGPRAMRLMWSGKPAQPVHHPYASVNWIRFVGSLRRICQQYLSPLSGPPG